MENKLELKLYYSNKSLNELDEEVFKELPLCNQYLISNLGRVKSKEQSVRHNSGKQAIKSARILTQTDNGSGYLSVGLTINKKTKTFRVSRLVAITWIDNPLNKPQVNHINGIKYDNRVINLEWNTSGENVMHAWNNNLAHKRKTFLELQEKLSIVNKYITHNVLVKTPIGLGKIITSQSCYRIIYENNKQENLVKSVRFWGDDFKLCLRSLSQLTTEIEHNGEKFVPISILEKKFRPLRRDLSIFIFNGSICIDIETEDYSQTIDLFDGFVIIQKLIEWHFDIYNLIDKNLAIELK